MNPSGPSGPSGPSNPSSPPDSPKGSSFATENKGLEESHAGIESVEKKKGFWGSYLVKSIKSAVRYIAGGVRMVFRNIRSFLITVCSPSDSFFRKGKGSSADGGADQVPRRRRAGQADARKAQGAAMFMHAMMSEIASPVVLVYNADLKRFVEHLKATNREGTSRFLYGVASPVDETGQLQNGVVAKVTKDLADDRYDQAVLERQDNQQSGPMEHRLTDISPSKEETCQPSDLNWWQGVYGMRLPPASDPAFFDDKLKEAILDVLRTADRDGVSRVVLPCPVGDQEAGGTGRRLAKVLYEALCDFRCSSDKEPPEVFLVGVEEKSVITEGCRIDKEFQAQWFACDRAGMQRQEAAKSESSNSSDAGPRVVADAARTGTEETTEAATEAATEVPDGAATEASGRAATKASSGAATRVDQDDDQSG